MSLSLLLQIVGVVLQALGIVLAGSGFLETYRQHDPEGLGFWTFYSEPARKRLRRARGRAASVVRRLLRRPQHVRVAVGSAHLTLGASARGRGLVGFGPLDTTDVIAALAELERRINDVRSGASREAGRLDDKLEAHKLELTDLSRRLELAMEELHERDRQVATGGIRRATSGLLLNMLGLLLVGAGLAFA